MNAFLYESCFFKGSVVRPLPKSTKKPKGQIVGGSSGGEVVAAREVEFLAEFRSKGTINLGISKTAKSCVVHKAVSGRARSPGLLAVASPGG